LVECLEELVLWIELNRSVTGLYYRREYKLLDIVGGVLLHHLHVIDNGGNYGQQDCCIDDHIVRSFCGISFGVYKDE